MEGDLAYEPICLGRRGDHPGILSRGQRGGTGVACEHSFLRHDLLASARGDLLTDLGLRLPETARASVAAVSGMVTVHGLCAVPS
ncbi:MAG: hypothetical protein ACC645_20590, partial [Pirellulales bacterium]